MKKKLTEHLNSIDTTGSIKDTLMIRNEDGTVKLLNRKKTDTGQYLNFTYHDPLHQKLGVTKKLGDNVRARGQRERGGAHHQSSRKMCVPKLDHKEVETTAISQGKNQRKKGKEHREKRYTHTPVSQRSNRTYTTDFKTP